MSRIATVLTDFADNGNSRTLSAPGHSALKPRVVIQKRTVALNAASSPEDTIDIVYGTSDAEGAVLASKVSFSVKVKRPLQGQPADVTAAMALFREIVASDNFTDMVVGQSWIG